MIRSFRDLGQASQDLMSFALYVQSIFFGLFVLGFDGFVSHASELLVVTAYLQLIVTRFFRSLLALRIANWFGSVQHFDYGAIWSTWNWSWRLHLCYFNTSNWFPLWSWLKLGRLCYLNPPLSWISPVYQTNTISVIPPIFVKSCSNSSSVYLSNFASLWPKDLNS